MKFDLWTLALQAVNVLVLLWLLHRFLYQPLRRVIAQRQALSTHQLQEANEAREHLQKERETVAAERRELAEARQQAEAEAKAAAAAERSRLIKQAEAEAAEQLRSVRSGLLAERTAAQRALMQEASALAVDIATRLLARLPALAQLDTFLDGVCRALDKLSPEVRNVAGSEIELLSATALDATAQALCRQRLQAVLGGELQLRFRADPALIAGLELHLPHAVVRHNWAHDLAQVLAALQADGHAA